MSAFDQCRDQGIRLKSYSAGTHRTTCPKCSHLRRRIHQKTACLAVTIKAEMTLWYCHHCGWEGGAPNAKSDNPRPKRRSETARSLYR